MIFTRFIDRHALTGWGAKSSQSPPLRNRSIRLSPSHISTYPTTVSTSLLTTSHFRASARQFYNLIKSSYLGTYQPQRYFSKGFQDADSKTNPPPIAYLITETNETFKPKQIPASPGLLRSLCRGKGVLKKNKQGLVYLHLDERFITDLLPALKKTQNLSQVPYFHLFNDPRGAHIPVISDRETAFHYLNVNKHLGDEFSFEIEGLYSMKPMVWNGVEQVWFFKVLSPELERLRNRYFLPEKLGGHDFHIAIAIHPNVQKQQQQHPIMRINVGCLAA